MPAMSKNVVQVALPVPLYRHFDYLMADDGNDQVPPLGGRVLVPFGRRQLVGLVVGFAEKSDLPAHKLRKIIDIIDDSPLLTEHLTQLTAWASQYYHHPLGEVMVGTLPQRIRQAKPMDEPVVASAEPIALVLNAEVLLPTLTDEQQQALSAITAEKRFAAFLLDGITGSGKTEVYLRAIEKVLTQGQQAMVLVPEIGLTPQTVQRFAKRFAVPVVAYHSGLTPKQKQAAWLDAKQGVAKVIIGTRSAVFLPMPNLGVVVVDEEHDGSYKQQSGFRYSARDLAVMRAHFKGVPAVLGSATPSLETWHNATAGRYQHLRLTKRIGSAKLPAVTVVNLCEQKLQAGLTTQAIDAIDSHLTAGGQVLVFLNRRGYAPVFMCHHCGWTAECQRCDMRFTLHKQPRQLRCHHCDRIESPPRVCPSCQQQEPAMVGIGTEQLEEFLKKQFADYSVIRIDRDSTQKKGQLEALLEQVHQKKTDIVLGTQMLTKGHHFNALSLTVIVNADSGLFSSDFRGVEQMGQLIIQVAGRAGRNDDRGEVLLQTHHPQHPHLQALLNQGFGEFADRLVQERDLTQLPPFGYLTLIRAESLRQSGAQAFLQQVKSCVLQASDVTGVTCLGPLPSPMEKRAGRYRQQLLLQSSNRQLLRAILNGCQQQIADLPSAKAVRWSIDVDPLEMY